jgi:hypothetical protein
MQYLETNQNNQFNLLLKSDYYEKALSPSYINGFDIGAVSTF